MLHAVIMAGGSGTRFWPQSRRKLPKQLLRLAGDRTMLQQTLDRCSSWAEPANSWIVTNEVQAAATQHQLPQLPADNLLIEPAARNTAPCIGLAALEILDRDPDGIMFVMPADHVIQPLEAFHNGVHRAVDIVQQSPQSLVLFGVTPTFPSTGYGYIERGQQLGEESPRLYEVKNFREKPHLSLAEQYIREGRFFWNCGIFCWKAATIVSLLEQFEPEMHAGLLRIRDGWRTGRRREAMATEFPQLKSISVDYAVLERAPSVVVLEAPFLWDDVGSWLSLPRLNGADASGNTIDGLFCGVDTHGCIVRTTNEHLVAALGLRNLIIVHTPDATLVADASQSERIKQVLEQLERQDLQNWL
ncbi:MAG: Alginate biosynthesis protein AlgA [Planctomycetota bacterium]|jgi:mannose-1-phosphate guanylyltransferase